MVAITSSPTFLYVIEFDNSSSFAAVKGFKTLILTLSAVKFSPFMVTLTSPPADSTTLSSKL